MLVILRGEFKVWGASDLLDYSLQEEWKINYDSHNRRNINPEQQDAAGGGRILCLQWIVKKYKGQASPSVTQQAALSQQDTGPRESCCDYELSALIFQKRNSKRSFHSTAQKKTLMICILGSNLAVITTAKVIPGLSYNLCCWAQNFTKSILDPKLSTHGLN